MASFFSSLLLLLAILFFSTTNAQNSLTLPIYKDSKTSQFYTTFQMGSNRATISTVLDLGGPYLWFSCNDYTSTTYAPIPCGSAKCDTAKGSECHGCNSGPPRPGCTNNTCTSFPYNPFQGIMVGQFFGEDTFYTRRTVTLAKLPFSCMYKEYTLGLASGTSGLLGLGRTEISLHKQFALKFNSPDRFSLCLPSSGVGKLSVGVLTYTNPDIAPSLKMTPLIINPISTYPIYTTGDPSDEYFIQVKAIRVNGSSLSVKDSYYSIDENGFGGTKISTLQNFTALHDSIYKPFTRAFEKAASDMKMKKVEAVAPFRACFSSDSITKTSSGLSVPEIELVLPGNGNDVYWKISGGNSMVEIDRKTTCLAFVNGGKDPRTSIVIGAHQFEDNLLEFDLTTSRLRFTSSLLVLGTNCSQPLINVSR